jgi:ethanolamine permease
VVSNSFPRGWEGVFASIPFAIWFFLGIEGVANVAEESINPKRTILIGFGSAILTLILLCILTFLSSTGVAGWEAIVYTAEGTTSDSPLPLALSQLVSTDNVLYHLLVTVGLFGLIASFHGIILAAGRSTYEFGRVGCAPALLGRVSSRFQTPANALIFNMAIGIIALLTGKTGEIITLAVFGALSLYILSMLTLLRLRQKEPRMERPFHVPGYPALPLIALLIALASIISLIVYNVELSIIYFAMLGGSYILFKLTRGKKFAVNQSSSDL